MADLPEKCPFCELPVQGQRQESDPAAIRIECPRCRSYTLTAREVEDLAGRPLTPRQMANASGWIREQPEAVAIDSGRLEFFRDRLRTPTVGERAERLMKHFGAIHSELSIGYDVGMDDPEVMGIAWAISPVEVRYLVMEYLGDARKFLRVEPYGGPLMMVTILPSGWEYIESLRVANPTSAIAFIAMHFDPSMEAARDRALVPAVRDAGYRPFVLDQNPTNRDLMDEVIANIRRSRFIVADFTGNRHNVYFEAGLAQGFGIPVIHSCRKDGIDAITFDLSQYPFLLWDPDDLEAFRRRLARHIEATVGRGPEAGHG